MNSHDLLVLGADAVHKIPHKGTQVSMSFDELMRYVSAPMVRERKDGDGGVALGRFRDGVRRLTHFEGTSLVGLDYDDGKLTPEQIHDRLGRTEHVVYPTFSQHHVTGLQKCRAILTLDRAVDLATHRRIMWVVYARAHERGFTLDRACKDASRWWFAPVVHPDRRAAYVVYASPEGGAPMSVDRLLGYADVLDAAEARRQEEYRRAHPPPSADVLGRPAYIKAALDKAAAKIARASPGNRHEVLNAEAYSLARLDLTEGEAAAVLVAAFIAAAGPEREREARRTVADAWKARGKS